MYYQENMEYKKKKIKAFQKLSQFSKWILLMLVFVLFLYVGLLGFVVAAYSFRVLL